MHSSILASIDKMERAVEREKLLQPTPPWDKEQSGKKATAERVERANADFWEFDRVYFPPEIHSKYAPPGQFHRELLSWFLQAGVDVVLGPREHAKTAYIKKMIVWAVLSGKHNLVAINAEVMPKASNILADISEIIVESARILHDYNIDIRQNNAEQFEFSIGKRLVSIGAFSQGRSLRGHTRKFARPTLLFCDDIETVKSSFGEEQVEARLKHLSESVQSLEGGGSAIIVGNNFEKRSALNRLKIEQEQGILPDGWRVHVRPAFTNGQPLWTEAYPATTEAEVRKYFSIRDEADWQGNYQQNPIPPQGTVFLRQHYQEWQSIPTDTQCVIYCDPNISLKLKGDTTAAGIVGWSASARKFYIAKAIVQSFSDPNSLLATITDLLRYGKKRGLPIYAIGFDGNVTQESTWTAFVRNHEQITKTPFPRLEYKRYNVDALTKSAQLIYSSGDLLFPPDYASNGGEKALEQWFAFQGKKSGKQDDFPDFVICAIELLHERRIVRQANATNFATKIIRHIF